MYEIVFLHDFPEAASFCSTHVERHWGISSKQAENIVSPCLVDAKMPFILVAKQHRLPVGFILATEKSTDPGASASPWLLLLYVKKGLRRQGIGTVLLERACHVLKDRGYERAYLDTMKMAAFYQKLGWEIVGTKPWKNQITTILSKRLV